MVILDKVENLHKYPEYQKVCEFLRKNQGKDLANGRYVIDENCYMTVSEYDTVSEDGVFEGHLKNVDVQIVVEGEEYVRVQDKEKCTLEIPYNASKDAAFYRASAWHNFYLGKGYFIVLEENDLHKPGISVNGTKKVKKYVFKVRQA